MRCFFFLGVLVALAGIATAAPNDVPWKSATYTKVAANQLLTDVLREFGADQDLPVVISEKVTGSVSGRFANLTPLKFLNDITQANGLIWYYDGQVIYVYRSDELTSKLMPLRGMKPVEFRDTLEKIGVLSDRFPLKILPDHDLIYVVGPPRYVEVLEQMSEAIEEQARTRANVEIAVEVFPLQYAWADDQSFTVGGNRVSIPGVATLLRGLLGDQQAAGALQGRVSQQGVYNLPGLRGFGLIQPQSIALQQAEQAAVNAQIAASQAVAQMNARAESTAESESKAKKAAAVKAVISADPRLNAIIVRDVRERMDGYRKIIRELDRPTGLVQIEATLVDVDADSGFQFGPPFDLRARHDGKLEVLNMRLDSPNAAPGNFTLSLLKNDAIQFLANVRALETEGHARIASKPSVLTINNVEAFLEETEEFFVRVGGFEQVDLFNITVGTKMRIVPHIALDGDERRIKLIIHLEDGNRSTTASVDDIPVVSRNTINTQAVLLEGQSLLIAGLMRDSVTKTERRLPILGRVPLVGRLFKTETNERTRRERMVLLTPRIVDLPTFTSGAGSTSDGQWPCWDDTLGPFPGVEPVPGGQPMPGVESMPEPLTPHDADASAAGRPGSFVPGAWPAHSVTGQADAPRGVAPATFQEPVADGQNPRELDRRTTPSAPPPNRRSATRRTMTRRISPLPSEPRDIRALHGDGDARMVVPRSPHATR